MRFFVIVVLSFLFARPIGAQPLVSADWVAAQAMNENVRIIDVGRAPGEFLTAHIPGSVFTDYKKDGWRVDRNGVPDVMNTVPALEALLGRLGIQAQSHVVLIAPGLSAYDMASATRLYWTLKMLGHERVSVLDGGLVGYAQKKLSLKAGPPRRAAPTVYSARPATGLEATLPDVQSGGVPLIDARTSDEYLGINKSDKVTRAGTLPGAINMPLVWMTVDGKGFFRKPGAVKALLDFANAPPDGPQIVFCNTGHTASLVWFVLHELQGNSQVRLYDGSLAEWSMDTKREVIGIVRIEGL